MRNAKRYQVLSAVTALLALQGTSRGDFSYNFDNLNGTGSPGTPLIGSSTTLGTVGQDNWVIASGATPQVRNDPPTGFSGNYVTATPAIPTNGMDSIFTRVGDNLGLSSTGYAVFQFDGTVGPGYVNSTGGTVMKRSEMMPGVDANMDGDIRGTSLSSENAEVAFQFGYESTGSGWFVRRAAYSNTGSIVAATDASGTYRMQLVVNFDANPVSGGNDAAGTLYVKQIADANGNAVNDVYRLAAPNAANVNLGLTTGMGSLGAANPVNWNGLSMRLADNGALDNIAITSGLPNTPPIWAADAGNWLSSGNWYLTVPNAVDAEADFTAGARQDSTVFADSAVTIGKMVINNAHTYVFGGAGSLTLQVSSGSALVDVQQPSVQKINLPLTIASDTTLNVVGGATLKISDPVTVNAGKAITQTGMGSVIYESNVNVQSGAAIALGNSTSIHALSLAGTSNAWTGKADVDHTLVLRSGDPAEVINQIKSGYNGGSWNGNGITSSAAAAANASHATALAYASAANLLGLTGSSTTMFDGQVVDASSIIVKYTLSGDANLDGVVNTTDFNALAANFNGSSKVWLSGDFNYDGQVNALDFNALASDFGAPLPSAPTLGALVPEPASLAMLSVTGILLRRRRRA